MIAISFRPAGGLGIDKTSLPSYDIEYMVLQSVLYRIFFPVAFVVEARLRLQLQLTTDCVFLADIIISASRVSEAFFDSIILKNTIIEYQMTIDKLAYCRGGIFGWIFLKWYHLY
jgi:hypothetical protein